MVLSLGGMGSCSDPSLRAHSGNTHRPPRPAHSSTAGSELSAFQGSQIWGRVKVQLSTYHQKKQEDKHSYSPGREKATHPISAG